ncbi:NAD-P-binding protein [Polyporus arcularius HHB13444]|uniref:NAD-P-binding protein n=1 Tax=Polyporus arcularius HHB13444 TaxID=1314778 RepID=A0A5C3PFY2_9APHY|nr:NAD-P-binding protein [Polyporus arcularius HHB13444]
MSSPRVVIVTGCSAGGIGSALCAEFAKRGCKVYATARRLEAMASLTHANIEHLRMDVTDDNSVNSAIEEVIQKEGRIDMLVNNAGVICSGSIIDVPLETIQRTFDANVFGAIRTSRAVIPHMASRKSGTIVNVGSFLAELPMPFSGIYAASKAALHSITDALYMECLPFNVSVVLVSSGGAQSQAIGRDRENSGLPPTTLYADYIDVIREQTDPGRSAMGTPLNQYSQELVGRVLKQCPPRYVSVGYGTTIVWLLQWLPRGFLYRLIWNYVIEKRRVELKKAQ